MPTLREYNVKLFRLRNTRKMMKTMKMVAASKLRKAQDAFVNTNKFAEEIQQAMKVSVGSSELSEHPLCKPRKKPRNAHLVVITSDRGLCGGFNNNLCRKILVWLSENAQKYEKIELSFLGRRGYQYFRKRAVVRKHYEGILTKIKFQNINHISLEVRDLFIRREHDEVFVAYNKYKSILSQIPVIEKMVPLDTSSAANKTADNSCYLIKPSVDDVLEALVAKLLAIKLFSAVIESVVGEHASRMRAMDQSTTNADKLIDTYVLLRNHARQSSITRELIEIIAGAESLA